MKRTILNRHYFDIIDTERKAYILGFLFADGHNCVSKDYVALSLHEQDKHILEEINTDFYPLPCLTYVPARQTNNRNNAAKYTLTIYTHEISHALNELGMTQGKSFTMRIPFDKIPKDLLRHFVRGYFDGDGHIGFTKVFTFPEYIINICSGSEHFLHDLTKILAEELGITTPVKKYKNANCFSINIYASRKVKLLGDWMYGDATIMLNRKRHSYDTFLRELAAKEKRRDGVSLRKSTGCWQLKINGQYKGIYSSEEAALKAKEEFLRSAK